MLGYLTALQRIIILFLNLNIMIKLKAGDFIYLQYMDEVIEITKEGVEDSKGTEFEYLREDELMATEKQIKEYKQSKQL